jgi:hypothetical protein
MNPVINQLISAERGRELQEQAAAWRRAREACSNVRAQPASISFALIVRNARSLAGQRRPHGPEAA